ncbi:SGNH/GDSL hydrolase family protein [Microbacterium sp. M3]|uniref:SGNH/GDSL hydrolase family protein n=1 Tax=Microbacterium arthrosphaerae TaxID=792652 RepID=A0ABU4H1M9_9MICO|nr:MULTISPECIES: SGNH/GDSL hydrolase family protein [Microbacterium]MDW4573235.1 SGNH/GDSL hydrolase family protein [Microbacterium arthrosphaerae]MDW7607090.1 SGNH/GDSL hydrolase family protein [Microbacterium sp. M3]
MHAPGHSRARRWGLPLLGAALAVAAVLTVAVLRPWGAPDAAPVVAVAEGEAPAAASAPPAPLVVEEGARVLVFGDSWVYGSAANVPTLGFAYVLADRLGVETVVDGVRGSGYLKPGIDGPSYGERIAALDPALDPDLIIVEGSINDRRLYPDGYRDAVTAAWDALNARYPDADIVILGPAPQVLPVEDATRRIDADLSAFAAARGWWYISPIAEDWITEANYLDVIDTGPIGRDHPSTGGHAYLADRVAAAIERIEQQPAVVADAPREGDGADR